MFYKTNNARRATELLANFFLLGCSDEKGDLENGVLAAVNIPGAVDADTAWKMLETGLKEGTWEIEDGDGRHPYTDDDAVEPAQ